jgi:hypothetical protein
MDPTMVDAYELGRLAKLQGRDRWHNPYVSGGKVEFAKQLAWDRGWHEAHEGPSRARSQTR